MRREHAAYQSGVAIRFSERQYDEKLHLLQAPALLFPDLHYYRGKCGVRDIPVAIAFTDIDKFKDFNTEVGHTNVNLHVLPVFMRAVEAHIYGHGHVHRMSGDEYAFLMPNADSDLAMGFVNGLRKRIAALRFLGVEKTISLSIGLCVIGYQTLVWAIPASLPADHVKP